MTTSIEIRVDDETLLGFIAQSTAVPRVGELLWLRTTFGAPMRSWRVVSVAYWADTTRDGFPGLSRAAVYVEPVTDEPKA